MFITHMKTKIWMQIYAKCELLLIPTHYTKLFVYNNSPGNVKYYLSCENIKQ